MDLFEKKTQPNIFIELFIPVFNGAELESYAPIHSAINALDYKSPHKLTKYLELLSIDDALYASYFWWREYYEVRNRAEDRAQAYCDLCEKLNNPSEPQKIYHDMNKWWVTDSKCRKFSPPRNS